MIETALIQRYVFGGKLWRLKSSRGGTKQQKRRSRDRYVFASGLNGYRGWFDTEVKRGFRLLKSSRGIK